MIKEFFERNALYIVSATGLAGIAVATVLNSTNPGQAEPQLTEFGPNSVPQGVDLGSHFANNTGAYYRYVANDQGEVSLSDAYCEDGIIRDVASNGGIWRMGEDVTVSPDGQTCRAEGMTFQMR